MPLHPQVVDLLATMERPDRPAMHELPIDVVRKLYLAMPQFLGPLGFDTPSTDRVIDGPLGTIPIRIHRPADLGSGAPVVVYFHGGGFCIGGLDSHDRECAAIAARARCVVVSVDYRQGPDHAYVAGQTRPAWIDDGLAAFSWAADHAPDLGGDAGRLVVAGDSAGGNIAAVIAQQARAESRSPAMQVLVYPVTDLRPEAEDRYPSYAENASAPILDAPIIEFFARHSRTGGDLASPQASPALADDLSGLAPALVITAELDPLRDEGEEYARRLAAAGVPTTLTRYDGMPHGFFNLGPSVDAADAAMAQVAAAIVAVPSAP